MSEHAPEKRIAPDRQQQAGELGLEPAAWPAHPGIRDVLSLQRSMGNRAISQLLQVGARAPRINGNGPESALGRSMNSAPPVAQAKSMNGHSGDQARSSSVGMAETPPGPTAESPARPLIVGDESELIQPGQMRKSEFLDELHASVSGAAEESLKGTIWSATGCPYIDRWFSYYSGQSIQHIERALHKYAPETAGARSAREYIPIVTRRLRHGIQQWSETGEITGVPEELAQGGMPGATAEGLMGGLVSGALSAAGSAVSSLVSGAGRSLSALFKEREGGSRETGDPEAIRGQLGTGQSLDGGTRGRMEKAFGVSFGGVRIHSGAQAGKLSESMNARAFTIGADIAFGGGEYKPGTLVGDALIAHELAHTIQQRGGSSSLGLARMGGQGESALEDEADAAAVGAMTSGWDVAQRASLPGAGTLTRLKSGLKLQRCSLFRARQERSPADYQRMTAWQLSRVPDDEFDRAATSAQPSGGFSVSDYKRASQLARATFSAFQIDFDIDTYDRPLGQEPNDAQLADLDSILNQILGMGSDAIRRIVAGPNGRGGRGLPTQGGGGAPTLRGRVRIWEKNDVLSRGQYAAKIYRLQRSMGVAPPELDQLVRELLPQFSIPISPSGRITEQEKFIAMFAHAGNFAAGFYLPQEDTFYLKPGLDLSSPEAKGTARHEIVHLLGGSERTREAFKRRYGANYLRYWRPFEEGVAEFVRLETQPETERKAMSEERSSTSGGGTVEIGQDPDYVAFPQWIGRLIATGPGNRDLLLQAYFTGNIPDSVFELIERTPPPAGKQ
jgi:hypothetical protein